MPSMQSLDVELRSCDDHRVASVRGVAEPGRQADRHFQVHRLQGVPGRVHAVERVHMLSAFFLIVAVIAHAYAAVWVKGTVRAMTRGTVSHGWAKHHHPLWYRKMTGTAK